MANGYLNLPIIVQTSGGVTGPMSSTNNAVATWNGGSGGALNNTALLYNSNTLHQAGSLTVAGSAAVVVASGSESLAIQSGSWAVLTGGMYTPNFVNLGDSVQNTNKDASQYKGFIQAGDAINGGGSDDVVFFAGANLYQDPQFGFSTLTGTYVYFQLNPNYDLSYISAAGSQSLILTGSGSVGVNCYSTQSPSAIFQVSSTTQGALFPTMTTDEKNAISSPAEGLIVYDLTLHALCVYNGTDWKTVTVS